VSYGVPGSAREGLGMSDRVVGGRYALVRELGRGAMGIVWAAEDKVMKRSVAVKELQARGGGRRQAVLDERILREARLAGRLSNPAIVTVYDVVREDSALYVVMELLSGTNLADLVTRDGPLDPARVARIGLDVLSALSAAHAAGVVHRDVKPANIVLTDGGPAKLTDFGIAQSVEDPRLTSTGLLVGTPAYLAPERLNGADATPESDLWALGATLFYAVEGRLAFGRANLAATMLAIVSERPVPTRCRGPLADAITGLLTPADTRIDAAAVHALLTRAATADHTSRPARKWVPVLAAVLVLAGVAALAIILSRGDSEKGQSAAGAPSSTSRTTSSTLRPPCAIDDIAVSGQVGERPRITIPAGCAAPTRVVNADLAPGAGDPSVPTTDESDVQLEYRSEVVTWSGAAAWSDWDLETAPTVHIGHFTADGLGGMRPGGRRIIVIPPNDPTWSAMQRLTGDGEQPWPADETIVMVVDLVSVALT
jgi:hypothetical protein